ncbi:MAG: toll/interleukin-1 receptor domain-containing protein, partial [Spirochaetales bacterium]|nr:toll/interleukin-1 receptor domain-containing protein [Spirochaetales bacterium]
MRIPFIVIIAVDLWALYFFFTFFLSPTIMIPVDSIKKVFISYSTRDREWVTKYLLAGLEDKGIPCHIDYRDFEIGPPILINIEKAFEQCSATIVVYSPGWVESKWALFEAMMLQTGDPINLKKKMLPIMLEKCEVPKRLQIFTYADFTDKKEWDAQRGRLISQIQKNFNTIEEKETYPPLDDRYIDISGMPGTGFELYGRQKELALLDDAWENENINLISFVAYGGVGKSTLVNKWLEKMRWDNFRGAGRVFAWSFYSQGTNEYVTSADMFFHFTLQWCGDEDPGAGSPWDKGKRLARLMAGKKTLLVLDGLEPLQSGAEMEKGRIKDPALSVFIREWVKRNRGLCIITTREDLPELDTFAHKTTQINLEQISCEAGIKLLTLRGVRGTEDELKQAVEAFGSHALAVQLCAEYLHRVPLHPAKKALDIPDLDIPVNEGKHPRRMIEAMSLEVCGAGPGRDLLFILGLFDRPVNKGAIDAVIAGSPVPGLTEELTKAAGKEWPGLLSQLRSCKLLAKESERRGDIVDCHPL